MALMCVHRAMRGFIGPQDIFRNPEAIFRYFKPTKDGSAPFDIVLSHSGADFAVMGMHFKLGLYEHQSAGALQGLVNALLKHPEALTKPIKSIKVVAYEPAFGIIGMCQHSTAQHITSCLLCGFERMYSHRQAYI
jgi:2-methylcitrate dehydratase